MKIKRLFSVLTNGRFSTLFTVLGLYIALSFVTRIIFLIWLANDTDFNLIYLLRAFDIATGLSFLLLSVIYLLLFPKRWIGSLADKVFTSCYLSFGLIIIFFGLMTEFPFEDEFGVRFNFIAVDYRYTLTKLCQTSINLIRYH